MPGEAYQCRATVQWYSSAFCPWLPGFPPGRCCKRVPMERVPWQTHCGAYIRRNCPGRVGFRWFAWDVEFTKIWVCLCSGFSVTICLSSQVLVTLMCSHSPSVFSSDCSTFPCWCLLEEPLDCFGDRVTSRAATHSCVNLSQVATSYVPTPFQCS